MISYSLLLLLYFRIGLISLLAVFRYMRAVLRVLLHSYRVGQMENASADWMCRPTIIAVGPHT